MTQANLLATAVSLGRGLYRRQMFRRLARNAVLVAALAFITAMMAGALLLGGVYAAYAAALEQGVTPHAAAMTVGALGALAVLLLALATWAAARRLLRPRTFPAQLGEVVDAFVNGFTGEGV